MKIHRGDSDQSPLVFILTEVHTPPEPMTLTLQQQAQETIETNVLKWSLMLCDALTADANHIKSANYGFELDSSGRKYHKIYMTINGRRDSIHAFIDKNNGYVYKPASVKAPAKGVRYNLLIISEREEMLEKCDWAGGYLYLR